MWAVGNKKNNLGKTETGVGTARPRLWNDVCGSRRAIAFAGLLKTAFNPNTKTRPTVTSYVCSAGCATSLVKGSWRRRLREWRREKRAREMGHASRRPGVDGRSISGQALGPGLYR